MSTHTTSSATNATNATDQPSQVPESAQVPMRPRGKPAKLSPAERKSRKNAYMREYYKKNSDKIRENSRRSANKTRLLAAAALSAGINV